MNHDRFEPQQQVDDDARGPTQHLPAADSQIARPVLNSQEAFAQARQLQEQAGWQRTVIEARLLARQSAAAIEAATGVSAQVIAVFEQHFFPVTHLLHAHGVIFREAIPARDDDFDPDVAPFLRGAGYVGGIRVLEETLAALGPNGRNLTAQHVDPSVRPLLRKVKEAISLKLYQNVTAADLPPILSQAKRYWRSPKRNRR